MIREYEWEVDADVLGDDLSVIAYARQGGSVPGTLVVEYDEETEMATFYDDTGDSRKELREIELTHIDLEEFDFDDAYRHLVDSFGFAGP